MTTFGDGTSPTARALIALEAIQASPGLTSIRLAERLGVTDRAARRYVAILREAGIPVESVTGPYGGYRIGRGARIPPLTFSNAEALGLVMAVLQGWHGSVDSDHPAAVALGKIIRVLPAGVAGPAESLRHVLAQNPGDASATPDPERTAALVGACDRGECVRVVYRSGARMTIEPWAVVVRHGRWYLLGLLRGVHERRVLRIDRILEFEATGEFCAPPADLDPVREVEEHMAEGWPHQVEVRIDAGVAEIGWCLPRALGRLVDTGDNSCRLTGSTENLAWYAEKLAALPCSFTIVGPPELGDAVRRLADRLRAATGTSSDDALARN